MNPLHPPPSDIIPRLCVVVGCVPTQLTPSYVIAHICAMASFKVELPATSLSSPWRDRCHTQWETRWPLPSPGRILRETSRPSPSPWRNLRRTHLLRHQDKAKNQKHLHHLLLIGIHGRTKCKPCLRRAKPPRWKSRIQPRLRAVAIHCLCHRRSTSPPSHAPRWSFPWTQVRVSSGWGPHFLEGVRRRRRFWIRNTVYSWIGMR